MVNGKYTDAAASMSHTILLRRSVQHFSHFMTNVDFPESVFRLVVTPLRSPVS
jgi:hypothetical protein